MNLKINFKRLIVSLLIPLVLGFAVGLITSAGNNYTNINQPFFAPPGYIFPIVWTILYILMGISSYIVLESNSYGKNNALRTYYIQLIVNLLWSFIFFTFKWYFFAFIWILLLIYLVFKMIKEFLNINKLSGYLQMPYLLWLIFACILNFVIFLIN